METSVFFSFHLLIYSVFLCEYSIWLSYEPGKQRRRGKEENRWLWGLEQPLFQLLIHSSLPPSPPSHPPHPIPHTQPQPQHPTHELEAHSQNPIFQKPLHPHFSAYTLKFPPIPFPDPSTQFAAPKFSTLIAQDRTHPCAEWCKAMGKWCYIYMYLLRWLSADGIWSGFQSHRKGGGIWSGT